MVDNFWIEKANIYSNEKFEINELGTHPHLIDLYKKYNNRGNKVLDYGCGDGSLIEKLNLNIEISLFDISKKMLEIATRKLKKYNPVIYESSGNLPSNYFDCIFLSMVLVCVETKSEIEKIAERIISSKKEDGILLIANPHPCFRDKPFSSYYTEYTIGKLFNYFNNGEGHETIIRSNFMKFKDYNWSITYLINLFISKGLQLVEIFELNDNDTNKFYNTQFSPSIIYTFK